MRSVSPVIHFESSEAKNTAAGGMFGCGLPGDEASIDNEVMFPAVDFKKQTIYVSTMNTSFASGNRRPDGTTPMDNFVCFPCQQEARELREVDRSIE